MRIKEVKKIGTSRVVLTPEFEVGDEVVVLDINLYYKLLKNE